MSGDRARLASLVGTEQLTIAAIEQVLRSPHLGHPGRTLARRILAAERVHAAALAAAVRAAGGAAPAPPGSSPAEIDRGLSARHVHRSVASLHSEHNCLDLLLDLESIAQGALYDVMAHLTDPAHQRLAAGLLAAEAQHEALLGLLRDPKNFDVAAPYAFVEGIRP